MTKALQTIAQPPRVFTRDGTVFTNSRDVAATFGKRHDNVVRDIENLRKEGVPNFGETPYVDPQNNQTYRSFDMDREAFSVLVMGFTGQKAIAWKIKYATAFRMMEEELKRIRPPAVVDLRDPAQLLQVTHQALLMLTETKQQLEIATAKIEADAPAVAYYQNFMDASGLFNLQNAGRALQEKPNKFIEWLKKQGYIFYQGGALVPKSSYRERGWFEVKALTVGETNRMQTFVTGRGLEKLSRELGKPIDLFGHVGSALSH